MAERMEVHAVMARSLHAAGMDAAHALRHRRPYGPWTRQPMDAPNPANGYHWWYLPRATDASDKEHE